MTSQQPATTQPAIATQQTTTQSATTQQAITTQPTTTQQATATPSSRHTTQHYNLPVIAEVLLVMLKLLAEIRKC